MAKACFISHVTESLPEWKECKNEISHNFDSQLFAYDWELRYIRGRLHIFATEQGEYGDNLSCPELMHDDSTLIEGICGSGMYHDCDGSTHIVSKIRVHLNHGWLSQPLGRFTAVMECLLMAISWARTRTVTGSTESTEKKSHVTSLTRPCSAAAAPGTGTTAGQKSGTGSNAVASSKLPAVTDFYSRCNTVFTILTVSVTLCHPLKQSEIYQSALPPWHPHWHSANSLRVKH